MSAITLSALQHTLGGTVIGLGGNVVGLSLTVDGVPILCSIDDGIDAGTPASVVVFGLDYPGHPDVWHTVPARDVTLDTAAQWARSHVWQDGTTARVPVYGTDSVRDAADSWISDTIVTRLQCDHCGQYLYRDTLSARQAVYRTETTGRTFCHPDDAVANGADERGCLRIHGSIVATYWQRTDALCDA